MRGKNLRWLWKRGNSGVLTETENADEEKQVGTY